MTTEQEMTQALAIIGEGHSILLTLANAMVDASKEIDHDDPDHDEVACALLAATMTGVLASLQIVTSPGSSRERLEKMAEDDENPLDTLVELAARGAKTASMLRRMESVIENADLDDTERVQVIEFMQNSDNPVTMLEEAIASMRQASDDSPAWPGMYL